LGTNLPHLFTPFPTNENRLNSSPPQKWKTALMGSGLKEGKFELQIKLTPTKRTVLHLHEGKPVVFTSPYIIRLAIFFVKPDTLGELVRWGELFLEELTTGFFHN